MPDRSVDLLREQLRERGYLSHGIERWFALDPWRSRAFWLELLTVAAKAGLLVALFAVLPLVAVMLVRNHPLTAWETLALALMYGVTAFAVSTTLLRHGLSTAIASNEARIFAPAAITNTRSQLPEDCCM